MNLLEEIKLRADLLKAKLKEIENDGLDHSITSAGEKGLRSGKVSELTVIAPVKPGGADRLRKILRILDGNLGGATKVGTLHDMRFVFLENDTKLLFCTAYDGDWDAYINDFATKIPLIMDLVFESVEGWPGITNPSVKEFILQHQHTADGWFVANPNLTVNDVTRNDKIVQGINRLIEEASVKK